MPKEAGGNRSARSWQAEMAPLAERSPGRRVDQSLERLPEIFHLD